MRVAYPRSGKRMDSYKLPHPRRPAHRVEAAADMENAKKILVLCTGNSCRSQLAEGYLRHFAGNRAEVYSAGIETHGVNPRAIAAMAEDGIDISGHTSNHVDEYRHIDFDYVITVCDNAREIGRASCRE